MKICAKSLAQTQAQQREKIFLLKKWLSKRKAFIKRFLFEIYLKHANRGSNLSIIKFQWSIILSLENRKKTSDVMDN